MPAPAVLLPDDVRRQIVDHCLAELPNEGCGLLAMASGDVVKAYPTANADQSPRSFTIPPDQHYAALIDAESNGWEIGGVFHSHPKGDAVMSSIDLERALEPDWLYLVVGLGGGEPELSVNKII